MHLKNTRIFFIFFLFLGVLGCSSGNKKQVISRYLSACKTCPTLNPVQPEAYLLEMKKKIASEKDIYLKKYIYRDIFFKAKAFESEMNFKAAEKFYTMLFEVNNTDEFIIQKLAISLMKNGNFNKAKQYLSESIDLNSKLSPEGVQLAMLLGNIYESSSEQDKSLALYQKVLSKNKGQIEVCLKIAEVLASRSEVSQSVEVLKKCHSNQKGKYQKAEIDFKLGRYYLDLSDLNLSEAHFLQAYATSPRNSKSLAALAVIYEETGRKKHYISLFKKHLEKFPDDYLILSRLLDDSIVKSNYTDSIKYLEKMSDLNSKQTDLKFKLTYLYKENGDLDKAIETLREVVADEKEVGKAYYFLADLYFKTGDDVKGFASLESIPLLSSYYADGTMKLADRYRKKALNPVEGGRFIASFDESQKKNLSEKYSNFIKQRLSTKSNPKLTFDLTLHKVLYLEKVKKFKKASKLLSKISNNPLFEEKHAFYLASLYEKTKTFSKADEIIKKLIANDPKNAAAHNFIGYSLLERNQGKYLEEAKVYIEKAFEIKSDDPHIMDSLAWLRFKEKKYQESLDLLLKANDMIGGDMTVFIHLGKVYQKLGRHKEAKVCLDEALKKANSKKDNMALKEITELIQRMAASASN